MQTDAAIPAVQAVSALIAWRAVKVVCRLISTATGARMAATAEVAAADRALEIFRAADTAEAMEETVGQHRMEMAAPDKVTRRAHLANRMAHCMPAAEAEDRGDRQRMADTEAAMAALEAVQAETRMALDSVQRPILEAAVVVDEVGLAAETAAAVSSSSAALRTT